MDLRCHHRTQGSFSCSRRWAQILKREDSASFRGFTRGAFGGGSNLRGWCYLLRLFRAGRPGAGRAFARPLVFLLALAGDGLRRFLVRLVLSVRASLARSASNRSASASASAVRCFGRGRASRAVLRRGGGPLVALAVALRRRSKTTSTTASTMGCSSSGSLGLRFAGRWDVLLICFTPALYQHAVSSSPYRRTAYRAPLESPFVV